MSDLLDTINGPEDLKRIPDDQLVTLAEEIRQRITEVVAKNAGHLASSLGVVELTLALHRVFDTPRDRLVWDVGHQAYVHKLVTGRREQFPTIRRKDGLSGYLRRSESPYDAFGAGHASTSISAALGIATARDLRGEDYHVVAIIGDGAMTGGLAWEGINNVGASGRDILIVLNDNHMSISPNVGALSKYFNDMITADLYNRLKNDIWYLLGRMPSMGRRVRAAISRIDQAIKSLLVPGVVFEKLGIRYFGPVDGHDLRALTAMLGQVKQLKGPRLLHVYTQKGKGVPYAEQDPLKWHGVSKFNCENGTIIKSDGPPSYTEVFGITLAKLCETYPNVVGITAAMASGCGLRHVAETHPDRFFDVGIAEQHAVTFAAGLATEGIKPVVAIYSTFLQRAYDQIIHDVAIQNLPVAFAIDRGGLVGEDGATHNGIFDLSYLRHIPNMVVMAPKDEPELQRMLLTMLRHDGPIAVRYPRGAGTGAPMIADVAALAPLEIGRWERLREGADAVALAVGAMVTPAMEAAATLAAEGMRVEVVNARFVKPLDEGMIDELLARQARWLTVEENVLAGGFGSAVLEAIEQRNASRPPRVLRLGIPDRFSEHGERAEVLDDVGLTAKGIAEALRSLVSQPPRAASVRSSPIAAL